jgi:hypothetical protein
MSDQVNLLTTQAPAVKRLAWMVGFFIASLVGIVLVSAINFLSLSNLSEKKTQVSIGLATEKNNLKSAREAAGLSDFDGLRSEISVYKAKISQQSTLVGLIQKGEIGNNYGHSRLLRILASQHQPGVWLTQLESVKSGTDLTIAGNALSGDIVMRYAQRLNLAFESLDTKPALRYVDLNREEFSAVATQESGKKIEGVRFKLR